MQSIRVIYAKLFSRFRRLEDIYDFAVELFGKCGVR